MVREQKPKNPPYQLTSAKQNQSQKKAPGKQVKQVEEYLDPSSVKEDQEGTSPGLKSKETPHLDSKKVNDNRLASIRLKYEKQLDSLNAELKESQKQVRVLKKQLTKSAQDNKELLSQISDQSELVQQLRKTNKSLTNQRKSSKDKQAKDLGDKDTQL